MKNKWKKIILTIISILILAGLTVILWNIFKAISTEEGRLEFRNLIMNLGALGCLLLIALNVSQIFLFFFPGEVVELLAGLCYGAVGGLIVIYIGALLPVNAPRFILLSTLFRFPGIITTTIAGEFFTQGNNRTALIVYAVTFVVSLLILWHFSRKEEIREIMDINKDK